MKIAADTNTYLAVALNEPERENLISLTSGHELVAPEVLPFEIGNSLSAMVKRGRLTQEESFAVYDIIKQVPVELRKVDIRQSIRIATEYKIYAYDAYWLECARKINCSIITLDKQMRMVARDMGLKIIEVEK